jgi:hypothetical protein
MSEERRVDDIEFTFVIEGELYKYNILSKCIAIPVGESSWRAAGRGNPHKDREEFIKAYRKYKLKRYKNKS